MSSWQYSWEFEKCCFLFSNKFAKVFVQKFVEKPCIFFSQKVIWSQWGVMWVEKWFFVILDWLEVNFCLSKQLRLRTGVHESMYYTSKDRERVQPAAQPAPQLAAESVPQPAPQPPAQPVAQRGEGLLGAGEQGWRVREQDFCSSVNISWNWKYFLKMFGICSKIGRFKFFSIIDIVCTLSRSGRR